MGRQFTRDSQSYIEARSNYADDKQRAAAAKFRTEKTIGLVAAVIGMLVFGGSFVYKGTAENMIESEMRPRVDQLTEELEQKKNDVDTNDAGHIIKYEDAVVSSALEKGSILCNFQNQLSAYKLEARKTGNSTLSEEHKKLLDEYRSYIVDIPSNMKGAWCEFGTWQFDSTFDFEGTRMQVAWRCYDHDVLLAMVVGTYDAELGRFSNMELYKTEQYQKLSAETPIVTTSFVTTANTEDTDITGDITLDTTGPVTDITGDTTNVTDITDTTGMTDTSQPVVTTASTTYSYTPATAATSYMYPEEQWFYGWSVEYQCWGYFDSNGNFMTEDEYQSYYGW